MIRKYTDYKRENVNKKLEDLGFPYHTIDGESYWDESGYWEFDSEEIEILEEAGTEVHKVLCETLSEVFEDDQNTLGYPREFFELAKRSWKAQGRHLGVYGRIDFALKNCHTFEPIAMEYNAETPTSLVESSIVQWQWHKELFPGMDQFNLIHESLENMWHQVYSIFSPKVIHFAFAASIEDEFNVKYLANTVHKVPTKIIPLEQIGLLDGELVDFENEKIEMLFKLYPWDWMIKEDFYQTVKENLTFEGQESLVILEAPYKALLSSKALFHEASMRHPECKYLPRTYLSPEGLGDAYVKKPVLGREGTGVSIHQKEKILESHCMDLETPQSGFVYQEKLYLPQNERDGKNAVLGVWIIQEVAVGLGIREDKSLITGNDACFVPHYFIP